MTNLSYFAGDFSGLKTGSAVFQEPFRPWKKNRTISHLKALTSFGFVEGRQVLLRSERRVRIN